MSRHLRLQAAKSESKSALDRHINMLNEVLEHSVTKNSNRDRFLYLMAVPVIYAAWEGFFRISCSICLRRKCQLGKKSKTYEYDYSTLWLQKEPFVSSFLNALVNGMQLGRAQKKITQGQFSAMSKFSQNLAEWHDKPLNHATDFDKLVMTHSNVNKSVTELNALIIGIDITAVDFSRIDELLNRRNEIAHGGIVNYPTENVVKELVEYTLDLITSFHRCVDVWLNQS
jgi:hypothetical protein